MNKANILIISHNFPPEFSSGILRTLSFVKNLHAMGWKVQVLTSKSYGGQNNRSLGPESIPKGIKINRIKSFNNRYTLNFKGKSIPFADYPDKYLTWSIVSIFLFLLNKTQREKTDIIFSTYPVVSSHLIGFALSWFLKKEWIADFRDPMLQDDYPEGRLQRIIWGWIEKRIVNNATKLIFTTESAMEKYLLTYPQLDHRKCHIISNGYIEEDFSGLQTKKNAGGIIKIIHAGGLYANGRNPYFLFKAVKMLLDKKELGREQIKIEFYGGGGDSLVRRFRKDVMSIGLIDIVRFFPGIPHKEMLQKMMDADILLLLQGKEFNKQIPGKIYEYFRLQRPILALTPESSETGKLIRAMEAGFVADQENGTEVFKTLQNILDLKKQQGMPVILKAKMKMFDRARQARQLSNIFSSILYKQESGK